MKKINAVIIVFIVALLFSSCGLNYQKVSNEPSTLPTGVKTTTAQATAQTETTTKKSDNNQTQKISSYSQTQKTAKENKTKLTAKTTKTTQSTATTSKKSDLECTVLINCSSIFDNYDKLKESKKEFLPDSGIILKETKINFKQGETAFDALKRACEMNSIQLESEFTPAFGSYYVEGIAQIYEKDCGTKSGWMYSVNSVFPNKGSSSYVLKDGDKVQWLYTCNNGEDIGA